MNSWNRKQSEMMQKIIQKTKKNFKKVLDKSSPLWYNIHKGSEGVSIPELPFIGDAGVNAHIKKIRTSNLAFAEGAFAHIKKICDKKKMISSYINHYPVLAGGAIRDLLIGKYPKDFDFFLDLSHLKHLNKDEKEDFHDLFCFFLGQSILGSDNDIHFSFRRVNGNGAYDKLQTSDTPDFGFFVSEAECYIEEVDLWGRIQIISGDFDLMDKNPLDIVDRFDYNMVKGGIDFSTNKLYLHKDLVYGMETKTVVLEDTEAYNRFRPHLKSFSTWATVFENNEPVKEVEKKETRLDFLIYLQERE